MTNTDSVTLQIEHVALDQITPDPRNVRTHPVRNIEALKQSLSQFGQTKPIVVDAEGIIRAGNGTYQAVLELGWTEIAIVRIPLTGHAAQAYAIADNRTAELAEWEYQTLAELLGDLCQADIDITQLGFADYELEPLLQAQWSPPEQTDDAFDPNATANPIKITVEQREIFNRALEAARVKEGKDLSEGRFCELLAADYLAGAEPDQPDQPDANE